MIWSFLGKQLSFFPLSLLIILLTSSVLWAEHLLWMQPYTDSVGTSCCNDADCVEAGARIIEMTSATTTVEVEWVIYQDVQWTINQIIELPTKSVHRAEGPTGYWCFRRGVWDMRTMKYCLQGKDELKDYL